MTARGPLVGILFGVIAMLGAASFKPAIQLVFNPTDGAPRDWYLVTPWLGDYVVAQIPRSAASLAEARGYLPTAVPLLKQVGAVADERVCIYNGLVYVAGVAVARALDVNSNGRTFGKLATVPRAHRRRVVSA